jgi:hypothetical protein
MTEAIDDLISRSRNLGNKYTDLQKRNERGSISNQQFYEASKPLLTELLLLYQQLTKLKTELGEQDMAKTYSIAAGKVERILEKI